MHKLESKLQYKFNNINLLETALTHSSYTKEHLIPREKCNERLEFLGDAVLETVICEQLYFRVPNAQEGMMTKIKSNIVRTPSLATVARSIDLGQYLILGHGEELVGGENKERILANAMESVIAAVYVDGGFKNAKNVVLSLFEEQIVKGLLGKLANDFKSEFQELVQSTGVHKIKYEVIREEGKSHEKTFFVNLNLDDKVVGSGSGRSKKIAENEAAKEAVLHMKKEL